jgi:hypothetical protein
MVRPIVLASFVVLLPVIAQAQGRALMPAVPHSTMVSPRLVARSSPAVFPRISSGARSLVRSGAAPSRTAMPRARGTRRPVSPQRQFETDDIVFGSDFIPVPGLGFDVPHLAATRGPGAVGAGRRRRQFPLFFPMLEGGFFLPPFSVAAEEAPETPQPEATDAEASERTQRLRVSPPAGELAAQTASAAPRETDEYVFVRRDGTLFFAVAYAWESGTLRYVTSEGLRRSVAREALDLDATQQFNEQRGLNFRLPA